MLLSPGGFELPPTNWLIFLAHYTHSVMTQCICGAASEQVTGGLESALHFLMLTQSAHWVQRHFHIMEKDKKYKKSLQHLKATALLNISAALTKAAQAGTFFTPNLFPLSLRLPSQAAELLWSCCSNRKCITTPLASSFNAQPINDWPPSLRCSMSPFVAL